MEWFAWLFVFVSWAIWRVGGEDEMGGTDNGFEWFIVIKYSHADWFGEHVDAHYVLTSCEAKRLVSMGPMKPGELLRGFWADNDGQREKASKLHEQRRKENRDFELLMEHIDECWMEAQGRGVFRDS